MNNKENLLTLSGKVLKPSLSTFFSPNFGSLYLRTMSLNVAAHKKYCCFNLNSLPSKN